MKINSKFLLKIFESSYMQRWNDKIRPIEFIEADKQAHKFMISYLLAKIEENFGKEINWIKLIEAFIFEFLQRLIVTDIKPTILDKILKDKEKKDQLNEWTFKKIEPYLIDVDEKFKNDYLDYFNKEEDSIEKRIIGAAHIYSSMWEFKIIEKFNPEGYDISFIKNWFNERMEKFYDLESVKQVSLYNSYKKFIDLCGQLRFQIRWANLLRFPKTSVLSHTLYVAVTSYMFTKINDGCEKRCYNNTFTGLFHDLPEVLTRDIISPVKNSIEGLIDIIKKCEKEEMENFVYPLIPEYIQKEIRYFTENEFEDIVIINGEVKQSSTDEINNKYNENQFSPRDGKFVKAMDELNAFIEAYLAICNGSKQPEFINAYKNLKQRYKEIGKIGKVDINEIFQEFKISDIEN